MKNERLERAQKFKESKKSEIINKLKESKVVENSPPVKQNRKVTAADKEAARLSKQLHKEISSAMKGVAKVMEHAFN